MPALGKGVLTGIGKRPHPDAVLPPTRLVLSAARIDPAAVAAYARLCGFPATGPLPVTYPHILGFPLAARLMSARAFPLPLLGLVHTTIAIDQRAPLHLDDRLELTVHAEELRAHRRGTEVVMTTEARREGRLVWSDRSSYLARHRAAADQTTTTPADAVPDARTDPPNPAKAASADVSPDLPVRAEWQLAADLGRRHAAVSGDYNPIHLHPLTARLLGFPRAIAHGMWTFARCAAEAVPPGAATLRIAAEFRAPVLLPATVAYAQQTGADGQGTTFHLRGGPADRPRLHLSGEVRMP
ncbi:MaoC family dehydratase [Streptomyces sp. NPDC017993]|uniref:MaoC family dehydratase n=1 Tax=Streptomyces sp. NPDC017993 TaxID=3365027 RepID=UPI0037ACE07E